MANPGNTEIRAALRDKERVGVVLRTAGPAGQSLKLLLGTPVGSRDSAEKQLARLPNSDSFHWQRDRVYEREQPRCLTRRELQVLGFIAQGLHNRQIAARIHRSIKTVEKHRQNLHSKLSTHEVAGLTRYALTIGLMDKKRRPSAGLGKGAKQLTPREIEVLKLVAQGSGNKWIASELHRSIKTVDHHRENIMKKLGIHEVAGLTRYAAFLGLM